MKLKDLLQQLALGELQNSPLVEVDGFEIQTRHLPKVIMYINQALEYIYSTYPLKTNEVIIKLQSGITRYYLDSDYALSNPHGSVKYIMDTLDRPFQDDVLQIIEVTSTDGTSFTINDSHSYINVNIPEYNCVQVENNLAEYLIVKYQARHPRIDLYETRDSNLKIHIPSSYETILQTYVAVLVYNSLGGAHLQESNALFAKFKSTLEELKLSGMGVLTQTGVNIKPQLGGWV